MRGFLFALLLPVAGWLAPTVAVFAQDQAQGRAQDPLPALVLEIGSARVTAEIARTPDQTTRGLMFRRHMDDNAGMLFVLGPEERASFWMENTLIPLSVAYIDKAGRIVEIHDMKPLDTTLVTSASDKIMYALEMNQGWFLLNRIPPGTPIHPVGAQFGKLPLAP